MAFFDNLSKTLSEKGKEAVKKAKGLTETMQLKGQISNEKDRMNEAFLAIGKLVFERQLSDDKLEYQEQFEVVYDAQKKIEELQKEIEKIEGVYICKNCGSKIPSDSSFCNNCGTKVDKVTEIIEGEIRLIEESDDSSQNSTLQVELMENKCPKCGEILEDGAKFCSICGQQIILAVEKNEHSV